MDTQLRQQLDLFLQTHEQSAFKMTLVLIKQREDALDIVQESMMKLVQNYAQKSAQEWPLLFYRIVQNKIRDYRRKKAFRDLFQIFLSNSKDSDPDDIIKHSKEQKTLSPDKQAQQHDNIKLIVQAVQTLPLRQQQTFILRAWQELSVKETAFTLSMSEGSVKTHYSRALNKLRNLLGEHHEPH